MLRTFWTGKIMGALNEKSVVWLSGVRRSGKTTICRSITGSSYYDCELPSVRSQLENPETFLKKAVREAKTSGNDIVILDEIHRLLNPSELLKIASDHFPSIKIIATGSSTLFAKNKFRDTLTGRKREVWLTPAISADLRDFSVNDIDTRILRGGLPPFLLAEEIHDQDYLEWIDSYWAKDILELFRVEKRVSFFKFIELLMRQNGGLFEAQSFSPACEVSRQTIVNYLSILESTHVVSVLRPFHNSSDNEIKQQPKVYTFDTGFVCFYRGESQLTTELRGNLLENMVLAEIQARFLKNEYFFWRNKQRHEIDFVVKKSRSQQIFAIECKSNSRHFDPNAMQIFRKSYKYGKNIVVCLDIEDSEIKLIGGLEVHLCNLRDLDKILAP